MPYNYDALNGAIVAKFHTQGNFAKAMGISERSMSLKLNNKRIFTQSEIDKAIELLEINPESIKNYFFVKQVQ